MLRRLHRLLPLVRAHRRTLLFGLCLLPIHGAAVLAFPWALGQLVRSLGGGSDAGLDLDTACLALLALAVLESVLRYGSRRAIIGASRRIERDLKRAMAGHMLALPIPWFDRARTGDLISRYTQDVELLRFLVGPVLLHGGSALLIVPGGLALMLASSVPVTLACGVGFLAMGLSLRWLLPRIHRAASRVQEELGELSQRAQEDFSGIRTVQAFAMEPGERAALAARQRRYLVAQQRLARTRAGFNLVLHAAGQGVVLAVLGLGGIQVLEGAMEPAELIEFLAWLGLMIWPLQALGWSIGSLPRAWAAAERIEELLGAEPEPSGGDRPDGPGRLEVRGLSFAYDGGPTVLEDLSFELEPGQTLGITGTVGSGKSTLLSVILRLYDPPAGTVFVDGCDVLELAPDALRRRFALAPQEPVLFSDTIAGNVALASGEDPIEAAVHSAALDQDLDLFDDGLQTVVGERGVTLSGGQRQRVSLARALASRRPTLVLDDTLSAVDVHTERRILQRLRSHRADRQDGTAIIVSQRLSALVDADEILFFDRGRIVERGTHEQLLAEGGAYAHAWSLQAEGQRLGGGDPR